MVSESVTPASAVIEPSATIDEVELETLFLPSDVEVCGIEPEPVWLTEEAVLSNAIPDILVVKGSAVFDIVGEVKISFLFDVDKLKRLEMSVLTKISVDEVGTLKMVDGDISLM